ncbi:MAG TPA: rhomboid family intramembrane serine protease [Gammaproteobacteria bacterium]|nr:rhomboid family intramembrane serine protease [Gammaproteobacteria bacterium]
MIPLRDDNPTRTRPIVTYALIGACLLTFLWQLALGPGNAEAAIYALGFIPAVFFGVDTLPAELDWLPAPLTIVTSMFLHGGILHLAGNLLYLWIFGDNIEDRMGRGRFFAFYVVCGFAAALAQALPDMGSRVPMIGASGAISGVLGAYILLYPHARVLVAVPVFVVLYTVRLPALFVLGLWFLGQLASSAIVGSAGAGVAFRAHIGGFVAGLAFVHLFARRSRD